MSVETMSGELLLLASNVDNAFVPDDLASRLEMSHVRTVLARSGLDWSTLLNLPAYDHDALAEICHESSHGANSTIHGQLASKAPLEVMRWGNKVAEVQSVLTANRISLTPYRIASEGEPKRLDADAPVSRRSRLVEWLEENASPELIRRLGEIATQQKLVREHPDAHWWAYRKVLRKQLQDHPRTAIQQIKAVNQKRNWHPEDTHRYDYFIALGNAARQEKPTREQIASLETYLEPFDPLVSYFGRQETADLLSRADADPARELMYRLHVIFFAPTVDASVRNVAKAVETIVRHPEILPDESVRFDALNGLIQTLRIRWEIRQTIAENSSKKILDDVDQTLVAVEKAVAMLDSIAVPAGVPESDWQIRKNVIERLMLRPLRTYRTNVAMKHLRGQTTGKTIFDEATHDDDFDTEEDNEP
jgi:hypothetical protein